MVEENHIPVHGMSVDRRTMGLVQYPLHDLGYNAITNEIQLLRRKEVLIFTSFWFLLCNDFCAISCEMLSQCSVLFSEFFVFPVH